MKLDEKIYTIAIFPHIFDFFLFLFPFVLLINHGKEGNAAKPSVCLEQI